MLSVLIAAAALAGTLLQVVLSLQQLATQEREAAKTYNIIDGWRREVPARRPLRRLRQQRQVKQVFRENPDESAMYWRVRLTLAAWLLLLVASSAALTQALGRL